MYSKCVTVPTIDTKLFPNLRFSSCCSSRNISSSICSRKRNDSSMYNKYMTVLTIDTELFPTSQLSSLLICHSITRHVVSSSPFVMVFFRRFRINTISIYSHWTECQRYLHRIFQINKSSQFSIDRSEVDKLICICHIFYIWNVFFSSNLSDILDKLMIIGTTIIISGTNNGVICSPWCDLSPPHSPSHQHINHPPLWRHWGPSGAVVPCITNTLFRLQNKSFSHTGCWASV